MEKLKKFGAWLLGIAVVVGGALLVLMKLKQPAEAPAKPVGVPEASKETEKAVQQAEVKSAADKAAAEAEAVAKVNEVSAAAVMDDGAERRKKLAELANKA